MCVCVYVCMCVCVCVCVCVARYISFPVEDETGYKLKRHNTKVQSKLSSR